MTFINEDEVKKWKAEVMNPSRVLPVIKYYFMNSVMMLRSRIPVDQATHEQNQAALQMLDDYTKHAQTGDMLLRQALNLYTTVLNTKDIAGESLRDCETVFPQFVDMKRDFLLMEEALKNYFEGKAA